MKLLIADDHPIFRKGLYDLLEKEYTGCTIIECETGTDAYKSIVEQHPDVSILDINMPGLNGIEVSKKVIAEIPKAKIVILTMYKEKEMVRKAMNNGVSGYIVKDFAVNEIIECINKVLENKKYIGSTLQAEYNELSMNKKEHAVSDLLATLSQAELKTLKLVNQNKSSKEIAELLFLSEKTIENYRSKICQKLGLPPRNNSLVLWISENKEILALLTEF
jgi:DNA-binding NarL/FixJ family response regulator